MQEIDWEQIWADKFVDGRQTMRDGKDIDTEYWSNRAESYSDGQTTNDFEYGRKVAEALHGLITPESELLDIGAGSGTFVIPFASKVRKVTAVEPS